jgi:uracil-DNA glycosylase
MGVVDQTIPLSEIARQVKACRRCAGLNIPRKTESAPGYGDPHAPVTIVGQSLCTDCMATQIPFTGGSGKLLDQAFALAGVRKEQLFITNVVHCHPPGNRKSKSHEIANCTPYLHAELAAVAPKIVIGLGADARSVLLAWATPQPRMWQPRIALPAPGERSALYLIHHPAAFLYHPERDTNKYVQELAEVIRWAFAGGTPCQP